MTKSNIVSQVTRAVEQAKNKLINKAKAKGLYENFGQVEVQKLKDKFDFVSIVYGTTEERQAAQFIQQFDEWCMTYNGR